MSNPNQLAGDEVGNKTIYRLVKRLGGGAFGEIYTGLNTATNTPVAIKAERIDAPAPQLFFEYERYKKMIGIKGFPRLYFFGPLHKNPGYHAIVMDLLGQSLTNLLGERPKDPAGIQRFSEATVIQIAMQTIALMQSLHGKHVIYRDVKPDNFVAGRRDDVIDGLPGSARIYIVDMGFTKPYVDVKTGQHIKPGTAIPLGTARYMSTATHDGWKQSRKNDLEALCYMLVFLVRGKVPWTDKGDSHAAISAIKKSVTGHGRGSLFAGLDPAFGAVFALVEALKFEEEPDYETYINLFTMSLVCKYPSSFGTFDWMKTSS
jgi:casein kinase 1